MSRKGCAPELLVVVGSVFLGAPVFIRVIEDDLSYNPAISGIQCKNCDNLPQNNVIGRDRHV